MRHPDGRNGFTFLEVVVAALLLTVGVGAVLGTATVTIGMMTRGRAWARAELAATSQFERLRAAAAAAPGACTQLADGVDSAGDGTAWTWRITAAGDRRAVSLAVSVPASAGRVVDTIATALWCR